MCSALEASSQCRFAWVKCLSSAHALRDEELAEKSPERTPRAGESTGLKLFAELGCATSAVGR